MGVRYLIKCVAREWLSTKQSHFKENIAEVMGFQMIPNTIKTSDNMCLCYNLLNIYVFIT